MTNLVDDIHSRCLNVSVADCKVLAKMLGSFAGDSPVLSYLPWVAAAALQSLLDRSATEFDAVTDEVFRTNAPLFMEFSGVLDRMLGCLASGQALLGQYTPFAQKLIAYLLAGRSGGPSLSSYECEQAPAFSNSHECFMSGVCAGVSQVRNRPRYAIDKEKDSTECRYQFVSGSHGSQRTGGIFTWFCRHGICYGFYIIPNAEGRNEAFCFLLKHFKVAPKVVVYHFACTLQDYSLSRQPALQDFSRTLCFW